jgi:hypothetical protein
MITTTPFIRRHGKTAYENGESFARKNAESWREQEASLEEILEVGEMCNIYSRASAKDGLMLGFTTEVMNFFMHESESPKPLPPQEDTTGAYTAGLLFAERGLSVWQGNGLTYQTMLYQVSRVMKVVYPQDEVRQSQFSSGACLGR